MPAKHLAACLALGVSACLSGRAVATEADLARFRAQLVEIVNVRERLNTKAACFDRGLKQYQTARDAATTAVAEEKRRLDEMGATSIRLQAEVAQFSADLESRRARLQVERARMDEIRAEGRNLAEKLQTCRSVFFLTPDICNWGENASRDNGSIRNIPREIDEQQPRLSGAQAGVDEDVGRLSTSQSALAQTTSDLASTKQRYDHLNDAIGSARNTAMLLADAVKSYRSGVGSLDTRIKRITLLLNTYDEDERDMVEKTINEGRSEQPATADKSAEPLPDDARAACAG